MEESETGCRSSSQGNSAVLLNQNCFPSAGADLIFVELHGVLHPCSHDVFSALNVQE